MEIHAVLAQAGLEERESKIYLATLELGESTVLPIAKKADIQRTYCYDILESLRDKGLITSIEKNGRRRYSAEPPEKIERILAERLANFSQILPELKSIYNKGGTKPKVRFYEGLEGVGQIYSELVQYDEYAAIGSAGDLDAHFHDYLATLAQTVVAKDIRARELLTRCEKPLAFVQGYTTERQEVRWLPTSVQLQTDMLLFGDKLVLISYSQDIHAIVIEGSTIVETHKQLFELLWEVGETDSGETI